jgi:hypothetical protein
MESPSKMSISGTTSKIKRKTSSLNANVHAWSNGGATREEEGVNYIGNSFIRNSDMKWHK